MNRGAFDFITKPIEFDDLETTIRKTMAHLKVLRDLQDRMTEAQRARATMSRYFSPGIVEAMARNPDCLAAGGERRVATFLFTDLADFTPLVESADPTQVVDLLNEYLDGVTGIVFDHGGTVMKIIGDAIHAMFGAPVEQSEHATRAVACALAVDDFAVAFQGRQKSKGVPLGVTRIGLHSGQAIIGNFGGEHFFEYTAYGDAVNIAARLEAANKRLGTRLCASQDVVDQIADFEGRPVGTLLLKGKSQALRAYEPLSSHRYASPATAGYIDAFAKVEAGDPTARQAFAALVGQHDDDPLANFHLGRLLAGEVGVDIDLGGN
jgi:adenylate cyclase